MSLLDLLILIVAGIAATGWFSASSVAVNQLPDAALVAVAVALGSVVVAAFSGLPSAARVAKLGRRDSIGAAVAGAVVFAAAPLAVLALRRTDAPSGSEVLFFTTAAWGALAVIAASLSTRRSSLVQLAAVSAGLLGAATIVANWERPSSFSPMVKFPTLEAGMLLAGVAFAIGSRYLCSLIRTGGVRPVLSIAWSGALAASLVAASVAVFASPVGLNQLTTAFSFLGVQLVIAGLSVGAFAVAWGSSLEHLGLARSASALFLPPALLTAIAATEGVARAALGPNPVQWGGAAGGIALTAVAVAALLGFEPPSPLPLRPEPRRGLGDAGPARPRIRFARAGGRRPVLAGARGDDRGSGGRPTLDGDLADDRRRDLGGMAASRGRALRRSADLRCRAILVVSSSANCGSCARHRNRSELAFCGRHATSDLDALAARRAPPRPWHGVCANGRSFGSPTRSGSLRS